MKKQNQLTANEYISKYLDNDLDKFLRRYYRVHNYELVYSRLLKKWDRINPGLGINIKLSAVYKYPGHISMVCNIHRIMMKYYGLYLDIEDWKISEAITLTLGTKIEKYIKDRVQSRLNKGISLEFISHKKALKELKARGFIPINDFEDFDRRLGHIMSNNNIKSEEKYIYPMNFSYGDHRKDDIMYWQLIPNVYNVMSMVGIRNYTRVRTPLDKN